MLTSGRATGEGTLRPDRSSAVVPMLDIRAFGYILRRRARLIATVIAGIMAAVVIGVVLATPRYSATAILIVDPRQQRVLQSEAVLSGIGQDTAAIESQVEILQSTAIAKSVIDQLGLAADPEFVRDSLLGRVAGFVRSVLGFKQEVASQDKAERLMTRFSDNLLVSRRGLTYVLEVRYRSERADKAARIANAVAAAYILDQTAAKDAATRQAAGWLNERLGELRRRVAEAERAVATYKAQYNIVDAGEGRTLGDRQVSELNQQLILARARTAEARARLDQVGKATAATVGSGAIPEALLSPVIANLRGQYAEAARREAETTSTFGPRHPAVATSRAQMNDIRLQIEREIARITAGIRNEFEVAQSRERSLDKSLSDLKTQSGVTGQAAVKLRELEREAQASRTLLEQTLLRFRETSEQEGLQRPDARVLSPASPPLKASEPKTMLVLLAGLIGSVVAGAGAAGIAESLSRGFRTTRELEDSLAIPVLGHLPLIGSWQPVRREPRRRITSASREARSARPDRKAVPATRHLARYGVDQPLTPFGEALRTVRNRIARESEGRPQILAVLSAVPNEGKSTVAINLAHSFAKSGLATLLIDVDVRKPGLPQDASAPGLMQMLDGSTGSDHPVFVDPVSGLNMLPLGHVEDVAAASELISGPAMKSLLERLRERFHVVVLDSPPLLPFVDGRTLLDHADAGVFVVAWNSTDADAANAALDLIGPSIRKIAGVVLNKVDLRAQRFYDYDYSYGQNYGQMEQSVSAA